MPCAPPAASSSEGERDIALQVFGLGQQVDAGTRAVGQGVRADSRARRQCGRGGQCGSESSFLALPPCPAVCGLGDLG